MISLLTFKEALKTAKSVFKNFPSYGEFLSFKHALKDKNPEHFECSGFFYA
ncbi:hypothetical protein PEPS_32000 (plasmid) [Persicobacter psychrovividus]|uniref:Restriction endonuclease n=1 Tax=Persicobacter psychrovividus TaxID=387638 RepID=A0ABN6LCQ8_9BACT|nr:hypothetical protein PEPS_32000 [Persicobacter psychrovividus]